MHSILQLFIRHGGLLTLVVVEVFCFYLISTYNDAQGEISATTWMQYSGTVLGWKTDLYDYVGLKDENTRLRIENARLQSQLANSRMIEVPTLDTVRRQVRADTLERKIIRPEYVLISGRVVGNTISGRNNWMIINRGKRDGVQPNTGVITRSGVAGVVRYVSDNFAIAMSVLHPQTKISAAVKGYEYFGSLVWDGDDPQYLTLTDIPYHLPVKPRDTIQISNYSLLFPEGHTVGLVDTAYRVQGSSFLYIRVKPTQTPASVNDVYVVTNRYAPELNDLQQAIKKDE
ncbi:MAG: rod shape-determining protein MreC [Lewinellaceae bacterium]|nr:rod shape-determining protein MreC [Lewinellaceae bacterium]